MQRRQPVPFNGLITLPPSPVSVPPCSTCGPTGRWECEQNACLIESDVIHAINRGNYGYGVKHKHRQRIDTHVPDGICRARSVVSRCCAPVPCFQVEGGELQPVLRHDSRRGHPLPSGHPETLQDHHEHERDPGKGASAPLEMSFVGSVSWRGYKLPPPPDPPSATVLTFDLVLKR